MLLLRLLPTGALHPHKHPTTVGLAALQPKSARALPATHIK
jgi:hypothetical protein